jgi:signal transduction histidine kinase
MPGEFFFLQDGNTGLRVQSPDLSVRVGDALEAAGFVETGYTLASLGNAVIRKLEPTRRLDPVTVTPNGILNPNFLQTYQPSAVSEDFNGRLVRLGGKLIKAESNTSSQVTTLLIESGGHTFEARLPRPPLVGGPADSDLWPEGAVLDLTAVCELEFATEKPTANFIPITGFHLWLRSRQDVRVINQPSWWTLSRLRFALLGAGCVILLGIAWIGLLRRLLRKRTARFEQTMRSHRNAELEYTAAQRERLRLAVDLHDGIKQHLAAASFRMEAAAGNLPNSPETASAHLEAASNTLARTQTELEECLWGLHAVAEGPPELVHLLRHVTANSPQWPEGAVTVASEGTPLPLSRDIAGSLLLLFQEATGNAFRHGRASHVAVTVTYDVDALDLRIQDDGVGFDPQTALGPRAGHFGIDGMKKRMQWLRGTLQIKRQPGGGMEIHAHLPWSPMTSNEAHMESETNSNTRQIP